MSSSIAPSEVRAAGIARIGAGLLALIAYQALAHWAATRAPGSMAAALVALAPVALALLWAGLRRSPMRGLAAALGCAAVVALLASIPAAAYALALAPQLIACLGLAWMFGSTLRPGREPLLTRVARGVHGSLPPRIAAYTRNVTLAWTLFLPAIAGASVLLFVLAPMRVWSLFANLLLLPLVGLMFLSEYLYRHLRYPWFAHATIAQTLGAFSRAYGSAPADTRTR